MKTNDAQLIDEHLIRKFSDEKLRFFRFFLWYCYSDVYNWKNLAQTIYHLQHLVFAFENYQIKEFFKEKLQNLVNYFTHFMKYLVTIQIQHANQNNLSTNQIDEYLLNLENHLSEFKQMIFSAKERFNLCKTDLIDLDNLLHFVENIQLKSQRNFTEQDQDKLHILSLKQILNEKSNKNDLIQMKNYFDNQIKKLIELHKQNAKEFDKIKLIKTSNCQTRHIQTILSQTKKSSQTSRPYITFELDQIRKYQKQALIQSRYGTIPLYRRQAWAAANLFPGYSLNFLRYTQNSLRMQIHDLLGYDPSDLCHVNKKKKPIKHSNIDINHKNEEIMIVGSNNRFYRGQIDSCEIIPSMTKSKEKKVKTKQNLEEKTDIHFEQFNQINANVFEENLFEYLDWQMNFNEQDLPDEICEDLFAHWTSMVCDEQPCDCLSESKLSLVTSEKNSISSENQCICSQCSCLCEKIDQEKSICLCSQCSCLCLKNIEEKFPSIHCLHSEIEENILSCDCFQNQSIEDVEFSPCF